MAEMKKLTHFDDSGQPRMVDVTEKSETARRAVAEGRVVFSPEAFQAVQEGRGKKGDIRSIAELAGVMGAKRTPDLIPLCHPLPVTAVNVSVAPESKTSSFIVTAEVKTTGKTGVEMEALTAVATACLTIYDMAKAIDKSIIIERIALVEKSGGRSGDFRREE
jgi:cyclic pyranopterin phosphate synthase